MTVFKVELDAGFKLEESRAREIQECMQNLIQRYSIVGLSILSIGAGTATEESHFQNANDLTLVDIDERGGDLVNHLSKLPRGNTRYHILDATASYVEAPASGWDLIYLSSFTPDEMRRTDLRDKSGRWREGSKPFHPVLDHYAKELSPRGRIIIQSYYNGGYDIFSESFHRDLKRQVESWGMFLDELYCYKENVGVRLFVISKPESSKPQGSPLSKFHGRSTVLDGDEVIPFILGGAPPVISRRVGPYSWRWRLGSSVRALVEKLH